MGGREEVLNASAFEIFGHMEMLSQKEEFEQQEKERQLWTQFLIQIYSQPVSDDEPASRKQQRQAFIDALQPKGGKVNMAKKLEWNIPQDVLDQAQKERIEGG